MMASRGPLLALVLSMGLSGFFLARTDAAYPRIYPPLQETLTSPQTDLFDVASVALGLRRLSADRAWVQTLQYYGTPEEGQSEMASENGLGNYPELLPMCTRVSRLDPYFTYIYYYGGASLAWNLNRPSDAQEFIKLGMAYNPTEWRLPLYLAAMAYEKNHDAANLARFLEQIVEDPECPIMIKALLANLYKKLHFYDKALQWWAHIYAEGDAGYKERAITQSKDILELKKRGLTD